jgi:tetratricopeptide (TPR) repeat protein/DNA-binding winged helix-turn-helix (wHTH) protein/TolB-like protein
MWELSGKPVYRFADVEIDAPRGLLKRAGQEIHLRQQTLQVLLYLLERRERLVTKEELFEHIWEGAAVTDNALLQCIFDIRRSLGDDSRRPRFVKTFPKVGYRFIGPVDEFYPDPPATFEIEEITAIQVEFEKESTGETLARADAQTRGLTDTAGRGDVDTAQAGVNPLSRVRVSPRLRLTASAAGLLILAGAVVLSVHFVRKPRQAQRQAEETALPREPGKRALAVMFFENQSQSAGLGWLRAGLADMLITDLSRSQKLSVLGRGQLHLLLERIGHDPQSNVRLDEALEVARRIQADTVVLGSFARLDSKIRVDVQLYDARTGGMLAAEHIVADQPGQILTQIDLLSMKLAAHLGAAPAEQNAGMGLAGVMTDNLEAYRYYSLAVEKAHGLHNAEAVALLEKAVALDPQFAMAHARIGYTYAVAWAFADKAKPYLEKAFRLSDRLTEKDRLHIAAWYSIANLDYPGAIKAFQEIIKKYPLEIEAYSALARLLRGENRLEEALEVAGQALVIDAGAKGLYNTLGTTYSELGRHDEALAMLRRYVELAPDEPNAHDSLGLGYQWAGRYAEAVQAYERALALDPNFEVAVVHLGNTYFQQGRYREAIAQYQRYIRVASTDLERARGFNSIAIVHWKKGELDEAEQAARKSLRYEKTSAESSLLVALARDDLATAAKLLEQFLAQWPYTDRGARRSARYISSLNGSFVLKNGRAADAIEHFKGALRQRPPIWHIDSFEDCLANAYLELGQFDEAIAEYERLLRLNPNYPLAHYHLAQAYEQKGQPGQALSAYERFLQVWGEADADLPALIAARDRLLKSQHQAQ